MKKIFEIAENFLHQHDIKIASKNIEKPWGGFFVIDLADIDKFINAFFSELPSQVLCNNKQPLSPKFLIVNANKRLSWQYHNRRAEIWKVLYGEVKVVSSFTDEENNEKIYKQNQIIILENGQRHRLIGLDIAGIVAEIWQHTNPLHLSDENDIVRLQDDFGR